MIAFADPAAFSHALATLPAPDPQARAAAAARQAELTKPAGSLGRLEEIAVFMAGWQGTPRSTWWCSRAITAAQRKASAPFRPK